MADLAAFAERQIVAAPWNQGMPQSDEEARDDLYFGHGVKVLRSDDYRRRLV